jgi:hypothetical protein
MANRWGHLTQGIRRRGLGRERVIHRRIWTCNIDNPVFTWFDRDLQQSLTPRITTRDDLAPAVPVLGKHPTWAGRQLGRSISAILARAWFEPWSETALERVHWSQGEGRPWRRGQEGSEAKSGSRDVGYETTSLGSESSIGYSSFLVVARLHSSSFVFTRPHSSSFVLAMRMRSRGERGETSEWAVQPQHRRLCQAWKMRGEPNVWGRRTQWSFRSGPLAPASSSCV